MKKNISIKVSMVFLAALLQLNCFPTPGSFRSARSLGVDSEGKPELQFKGALSGAGSLTSLVPGCFIDAMLNVSLMPHTLEFSARLATVSFTSIELRPGVKYTFFEKDNFAMAVALEAAFLTTVYSFSVSPAYRYYTAGLIPAFIMTWDINPDFSMTLAPWANVDLWTNFGGKNSSFTNSQLGLTFTFDIGKKLFGVMPELGVIYVPNFGGFSWHFGVALRFG